MFPDEYWQSPFIRYERASIYELTSFDDFGIPFLWTSWSELLTSLQTRCQRGTRGLIFFKHRCGADTVGQSAGDGI